MRILCSAIVFCSLFAASSLSSSVCNECNQQLANVAAIWNTAGDDKAVAEALYDTCKAIAPNQLQLCQSIRESLPKVVDRLEHLMSSGSGCQQLGVCGSSAEQVLMSVRSSIQEHIAALPQVQDDALCTLCEFMVKQIDQLLQNNKTLAEIKAGLEKFCDSLSLKQKLLCKAAVPVIMKELENGINPKNACVAVNMCPNNSVNALELTGLMCGPCKTTVDLIGRLLYDNIGTIQNMGDSLCHRLPPDTDDACLDFINNHLEGTISKLLNTTLSPDTVCTKFVRLCKE